MGAAAFSSAPIASAARATTPVVRMDAGSPPTSRRSVLAGAVGALLPAMGALPALAGDDFMKAYSLKKAYPVDARQMLNNMVIATVLARGAPDMEKVVKA